MQPVPILFSHNRKDTEQFVRLADAPTSTSGPNGTTSSLDDIRARMEVWAGATAEEDAS